MKNQFDYDEDIMHQQTRHINMPNPTPRTPNSQPTNHPFFNSKQNNKNHLPQQSGKQISIVNRVSQILLKKQVKIKERKLQQLKNEIKQCTFKPRTISHNKKKGQRRTFNEFLQEQIQFQKKVENKCKTIKHNIENKEINDSFFQPTINKKSKQMQISRKKDAQIQDVQDNTVFDRLYTLRDKENQHPNIKIDLFIPQINQKSKKIIRPSAIQNVLYDDAIRRQQKLNTEPAINLSMKTERSISLNNQRYCANKFIKEYCLVLQKLEIIQTKSKTISFMIFNQLLKQLHFVNPQQTNSNDNNIQNMLVNEAYQYVAAHAANIRNVCVFLLAIIGIFNINPLNFQKQKQANKQMEINESVGRKINAYFQCFKRNRLSYDQKMKRKDDSYSQQHKKQQFPFHPKINKISEELAEKNREEMLQQASVLLQKYPQLKKNIPKAKNGKINNADLLVLKNMVKQQKIKKQKQQKEKLNLAECTFKPSTTNYISSHNNQSTTCGAYGLGQKKSLQLYNEYKDRLAYRQYLHSNKRDPQEQSIRHCTFSPSINPFNLQSSHYESSPHNSASLIKNKKSNIKSKSKNSQKRFITSPNQHNNDLMGQFDLSISFGQQIEYIKLRVGDFQRMDEMVEILSEKYELKVQERISLHQLLRRQMELARLYNEKNSFL